MRFEVLMLLLASGTVASTAALSSPEAEDRIWRYRHSDALMVGDFADLRREALDLMPRGSRLDAAERKLISIGFSCSGTPHGLPNVNGPSLVCSSNGRGYPVSPQINLTVMSRSGLVSDYEVWNLFESASASTLAPEVMGRPAAISAGLRGRFRLLSPPVAASLARDGL